MSSAIAISKDSTLITGRGYILDLVHNENGLLQGTILTSEKSKRQWELKARVLFDHAVDIQRVFNNEQTEFMLIRFSNSEMKEESRKKIKEKEDKNSFLYMIKPIGHNEKPEDGEKLIINL